MIRRELSLSLSLDRIDYYLSEFLSRKLANWCNRNRVFVSKTMKKDFMIDEHTYVRTIRRSQNFPLVSRSLPPTK